MLPAGERTLAHAGLSVGIVSASQGRYAPAQLLLDITQGARVAASAYPHSAPPSLALRRQGREGAIAGWARAVARARRAPQLLSPGLLAQSLPGGAAYVGTSAAEGLDAVIAADEAGRIGSVSLGEAATLPARIAAAGRPGGLTVADLPGGEPGAQLLTRLVASRPSGELLIALQRVPAAGHGELLWAGAAGLAGAAGRELISQTTQQHGLIASVDLAPTILEFLGAKAPEQMRGRTLETSGALDGGALRSLMARLRVVGARRLSALGFLVLGWLALVLLAALGPPAARARAVRAGGMGVLWAPVAVMATAAIEPGAGPEYALIAVICLGLGALSDLLLAWPRALIAPAIAVPAAIVLDALVHTQLLMRSLLGPNPMLGARFFGIGNELKSALAVLVLAAVAGALHPARRDRRSVAAVLTAGLVLAAIEGAARIGAGVGGVILVCAGTAVAGVMLAPGTLTRKRALLVLVSPVAGLVALAAIDLATAHGSGHFTGSILHARSAGDVRDILVRRYKAAWDELRNHAMPVATALSVGCAIAALRARERLLAPVGGDPVWLAALAGGLTAGVVGALVEDSGAVLLLVASFTLGCVLSYLWAPPPGRSAGKLPGARSRARRRPAARVR